MRSEQEIRNEINRLRTLEKEAIADMEELIAEGSDFLEIYIQKANMFQCQRVSLEWVLNETTT
jgi:hypothetical protein